MRNRAEKVKAAICGSVEIDDYPGGVTKISTPFLDWKGLEVAVFVRANGEVTDGGRTLNELRALNLLETFEEWPYRLDFFDRYAMEEKENALVCSDSDNPDAIMDYALGLARLAAHFEVKVPSEPPDNFIRDVRVSVRQILLDQLGRTDLVAEKVRSILNTKRLLIRGVPVKLDFNPIDKQVFIQAVGRFQSTASVKLEHVNAKVTPHLVAKTRGHQHRFVVAIQDLSKYPSGARKLIEEETDEIIEMQGESGRNRLAEVLVQPYRPE